MRVAILRQHAQHVAMQIAFAAGLQAWNGETESHHALAIKGAERVPAHLGGHHEQAQRQQFDLFKSPYFLLQAHSVLKLAVWGKLSDFNHRRPWPPAIGFPFPGWSRPEARRAFRR